jgi:NitT/TauT family transport system permease protein
LAAGGDGREDISLRPWTSVALWSSFFETLPGFTPIEDITMGDLIVSSLIRVFWGFLIALGVAFPLGIIMGRIGAAEAFGRPIVEMFRPIPPLAWVPIFLLIFGSFWGPTGIVFLGAFFPILLNVMFGVKSVDPQLVDAARTLGAKRSHIFAKVIIPSSVPYLMTGVTVGLGVAWMCIVAAEITPMEGGAGLGYYILYSANFLGRYEYTYATMIVIGILSMLTTGVAALIERRVSKWMGLK